MSKQQKTGIREQIQPGNVVVVRVRKDGRIVAEIEGRVDRIVDLDGRGHEVHVVPPWEQVPLLRIKSWEANFEVTK